MSGRKNKIAYFYDSELGLLLGSRSGWGAMARGLGGHGKSPQPATLRSSSAAQLVCITKPSLFHPPHSTSQMTTRGTTTGQTTP